MNFSLILLWKKLSQISRFEVYSESGSHWEGSGTVSTTLGEDQSILFKENGTWHTPNVPFTNKLRWIFYPNRLYLEHLRFDRQAPTTLAEFIPDRSHRATCSSPYFCGKDRYIAGISWTAHEVSLFWEIHGPQKNEVLHVVYKEPPCMKNKEAFGLKK